ncbi:sugar transferase [Alphaproteobacteria bacterium]|nr:sugar transferase [Alphaproteobacteria bacterium]
MKIIITGASGFIGSLIVPELKRKGIKMLLVTRSFKKLNKLYPNNKVCEYDDLEKFADDYDCIIHLATINNRKNYNSYNAREENFKIFKKVFSVAKLFNLYFINFSTTHSLNFSYMTDYAESKRDIEKYINSTNYPKIRSIYLPFIYGNKMSGKLKILNAFPRTASNIIFYFLSAFKPTVNINTVLNYLFKSKLNLKKNNLIILSENICKNFVFLFFKRSFDLFFSVFIILFFWWFLILVWVIIKIETPGPGIIFQKRVGKSGKIFNCIKFRTMKSGVKQAPTHHMSSTDLTVVGGFLRTTKLDELPQVFNIILNEMSLVGPRPCLEIQHKLISKRKEFSILELKPGITGLAQISKADMSNINNITKFDFIYLKTQSIFVDINIIFKTIFGAGNIDNVKN